MQTGGGSATGAMAIEATEAEAATTRAEAAAAAAMVVLAEAAAADTAAVDLTSTVDVVAVATDCRRWRQVRQ